ncbi:MAG: LysM domain-containing protein [Pseudomonadota bacterium]
MKKFHLVALLAFFSIFSITVPESFADNQAVFTNVKVDAPIRYVVRDDDSVWKIASMYLEDPLNWLDLWQLHLNPHDAYTLYPGDVLALIRVNGRPYIKFVERKVDLFEKAQGE